MIEVTQQGKKFIVKGMRFATREEAQMMADILNERDPVKAQALIDAKNAKFPRK